MLFEQIKLVAFLIQSAAVWFGPHNIKILPTFKNQISQKNPDIQLILKNMYTNMQQSAAAVATSD